MNRFAQGFACAVNSDRGAESVHIRDLMSHDYDPFFGAHEFFQRLGFHAGFHTRGLLHLLRLAAEIGDIIAVLDDHLIAAAAQCHLDSNTAVFIILKIIGCV